MAGLRQPADLRALMLIAGLLLSGQRVRAEDIPPELAGTSPGERSAIEALCGASHGSVGRSMCLSNQRIGLLRLGRKPDLTGLTSQQRAAINAACSDKTLPPERFACERAELAASGLPVRDEPGGSALHVELAGAPSLMAPTVEPKIAQPAGLPFFSLEKWRAQRPIMPIAHNGSALKPAALYQRVAPSIYIVLAGDHAIELSGQTAHSQGSAVAITDRILLTNCHVIEGRPQISLSQQGRSGHASLIYADPGGDRCFLHSDDFPVHPIQGVRRFDSLHVGEQVFSLGTPVGLELSYGEGMISGLRQIEGVRMIQNSAPTWHGSSGGGLFDDAGNLVGITTAISAAAANLNFSIAAEDFWP